MWILIELAIYFVGCVLAYILFKKLIMGNFFEWTKGDRALVLALSIFSWVGVIIALLLLGIECVFSLDWLNDEAKW